MAEGSAPPDTQELVDLARRFADLKRYDEALELFQLALRLDPRDLGIRLAVARLRKLRRAVVRTPEKDPTDALKDGIRRSSIDGAHYVGLAQLYAGRDEQFPALECLDLARARDATDPANFKLAGTIHFSLQDFDAAADHLRQALRFDPFDRETAEMLGRVEYERKQFEPALAATIDAFLLLPPYDDEHALRLRRRIRTLRQILDWETAQVVGLYREREEELHTAFDRLQWRRERFRGAEGIADGVAPPPSEPVGGRLSLAARLRRSEIWAHLTDEQIFALSFSLIEESVPADTNHHRGRADGRRHRAQAGAPAALRG
jgi:tetratricopeptide (TPR) repeat protein